MTTPFDDYIRKRARQMGLSLSKLCNTAGVGRQTLYDIWRDNGNLPSLGTIIALSKALRVHPLALLEQYFSGMKLAPTHATETPGDRSAFVSDITIPDGEWILTNTVFRKTWELENIGDVAWENRFLQCQDEELVILSRQGEHIALAQNLQPHQSRTPIPDTLPGQRVRISVDFTAPALPGSVMSYWKMTHEDGSLCFPNSRGLWVKVQVVTALSPYGL